MHPECDLHEAQSVKNPYAMQQTQLQPLGQEDSLGRKWQPPSVYFLPGIWRTEKPEVTKRRTQLSDWTTLVPQPSQDGLPLGHPLPGPSVWRFLHYTLQAPGPHSQQIPPLLLYCDHGTPQASIALTTYTSAWTSIHALSWAQPHWRCSFPLSKKLNSLVSFFVVVT